MGLPLGSINLSTTGLLTQYQAHIQGNAASLTGKDDQGVDVKFHDLGKILDQLADTEQHLHDGFLIHGWLASHTFQEGISPDLI
jgi:hypothetical protein